MKQIDVYELARKKEYKCIRAKVEELVAQWNYLPPQEYDNDKMVFYIKKNAEYSGIQQEIIHSPPSFEALLCSKIKSSIISAIREPVYSPYSLPSPSNKSLRSSLTSLLESPLWSGADSSFWPSFWGLVETSIGPLVQETNLSSSGFWIWSVFWSSLESSICSLFWVSRKLADKPVNKLSLVYDSLISSLNFSVWHSIYSSLISILKSSFAAKLNSQLWSHFELKYRKRIMSSILSGHDFVFWDVYNKFYENNLARHFFIYLADAYKAGLCFAFIDQEKIYAMPFPKYYLNRQNRFHRDLGPAVTWADGTKHYYLNGVKVPGKIAETPAERLNPNILLRERNAEIRREIVRKIGIKRVCYLLNAEAIDKRRDYELLILTLQGGRKRPYLKMKNPSSGIYHLEGVPPEIKNVQEALNWRNQAEEEPEIVT